MISIYKATLLVLLVVMCFYSESSAQNWSNSANNYTTGNLGLGSSASSYKLDIINQSNEAQNLLRVKVNGAPSDYFIIGNQTGMSGQFIPGLWGYHDTDNRQALYMVGAIGSSNDSGYEPIMIFDSRISSGPVSSRPLFAWDSYGNRKMILSATGNLGIGAVPSMPSRLNIEAAAGGEQIRMSRGTGVVRFAQDYNKDALYLFNSNASQTYMCWKENGFVGIGTQNPDAKLAVKGTIHTQEVKVDMIGWSDYVFDKDYDLPTLEEVKNYIDQHHHLPEIPSAKEVVENGIMLGEMNKLLIKKMEEMTLYMIEMKEEIEKQRIEIEKLKNN